MEIRVSLGVGAAVFARFLRISSHLDTVLAGGEKAVYGGLMRLIATSGITVYSLIILPMLTCHEFCQYMSLSKVA